MNFQDISLCFRIYDNLSRIIPTNILNCSVCLSVWLAGCARSLFTFHTNTFLEALEKTSLCENSLSLAEGE